MRGLTRSGVKHVCSPNVARPRQQHVTKIEIVTSTVPNSPRILLRLPSTQFTAGIFTFQGVRHRKKPTADTRLGLSNGVGHKGRCLSGLGVDGSEEKVYPIELDENQQRRVRAVHKLRKRLAVGISELPTQNDNEGDGGALTLEAALNLIPTAAQAGDEGLVQALKARYGKEPVKSVDDVLGKVAMHRNPAQRKVSDIETVKLMATLGLVEPNQTEPHQKSDKVAETKSSKTFAAPKPVHTRIIETPPTIQQKGALMSALSTAQEIRKTKMAARKPALTVPVRLVPSTAPPSTSGRNTLHRSLVPRELELKPLDIADLETNVPELSFDLSRVLFNPGIYHLQDPRSRVFNFDPYLAQPMPMSEFNFGALNEYITSSKDETLIAYALAHRKRYIGSSSSMSGALCQFHFLFSQFREINAANLSKGFGEEKTDFSLITKAPAAIFLRWRNGVYAVDADKEYDEPNVLLSLGKSLEKLLTLEKKEFEKWRKTGTEEDANFSDANPEAYYYSTQGDFLLRSQLDAKDGRLPGTGVFDLKTRAVAGIRFNVREHEIGMGYQIKDRFGTWESFEREYYDMIRSAFLKYSMQVRMGNMDGIFVAYHNIARLFGFQYIPITELDLALHGQSDPSIGDQEFRMSISLMDQIFDIVTAKFPKQSIRFHFETRDASARDTKPYMHVFAEPMTDEEVNEIQAKQDLEFAAYEKKIAADPVAEEHLPPAEADLSLPTQSQKSTDDDLAVQSEVQLVSQSSDSSDANTDVLEHVLQQVPADVKAPEPRPLLALKIVISNKVNDMSVVRPEQITAAARWTVDFTIEELADEAARRRYITCKNRRMTALKTSVRQNQGFLANINDMSRSGAVWRQEQDEMDAGRERIVLYPNRMD